MKSNYLCLIELLNFDKIVSAFGNDMLQITINKISKDLATALAGCEHEVYCCNFGDSILIQTESDSDEELSKLVRVLSAYNKQALMFGYPHKGIVLKQTGVVPLCDAIKTYNSKALFDAKAVLKEQNFTGIVINSDLYCEKQHIFESFAESFEQYAVFKIQKAKLTDVALNGVKKSVESNFAKVGIDAFSSRREILNFVLRFIEKGNK